VLDAVRHTFTFLDRVLGRGSYRLLKRWLDPHTEYTQMTFGRILDEELGPSARWLDAGCGHEVLKHGAGMEQFDLLSKPAMAAGCDIDLGSLREHHMFGNRVCCNLGDLPFRSASFDVVSLNNVAEHLADPAKVFAEIGRILVHDGCLIVHTPNVRSLFMRSVRLGRLLLPERFVVFMIKFLEHREEKDVFPTFYRTNNKRQLARFAAEAGMITQRIAPIRDRPLFYFFAPLSAAELLLMRLLDRLGMDELSGPVLLGVFRRKTADSNVPTKVNELDELSPALVASHQAGADVVMRGNCSAGAARNAEHRASTEQGVSRERL
jgi:SAM-dependent methyltransferase